MMGLPLADRLRAAGGLGLQAFDVPGFSSLWSANIAWNVARWVEQIAVGWIALELTGSAFLVALIGFYRSVPLFFLGMFGGVLGDRYDRRTLVLALQVVNVAVSAALAALTLGGRIGYTDLAVAEIVLGMSQAFDWPSRRSLLADLVGRERLPNAVALDASGQNLSRVGGPLISGLVIAVLNPGIALAILAGLYLINLGLVVSFPPLPRRRVAARVGGAWPSLRSGLSELTRDEAIVGVLLITVWMNFCFFPYQQLLPVVAVDVLHTDSAGLGVLSAADGFGSLLGTLVLGAYASSRGHGFHFWFASLAAAIALLVFSLVRAFSLAVLIQVASGLVRSGFSVYQSTIILRRCSDELRARGMGALTLAIGAGPFGQLEMGAIAQILGSPAAMAVNAVACAVLTGAVVLRFRGLRGA
jgi:MFS family permease